MKQFIRTVTTVSAITCVLAAGTLGTPALAASNAPADSEKEHSFLVPTDVPDSLDASPTLPDEYNAEADIPGDVSHRLIQMTLDEPGLRVASTQWDPKAKKLILYSAADPAATAAAIEEYDLDAWVEHAPAAHSADELNAIVRDIIGTTGKLETGQQVALVKPSPDAASIELVLDEKQASANEQSRSTPPDLSTPALDVNVTYGEMPTPTLRNISGTPYKFAGAWMRNGVVGCTTGWRMTQISTSTAMMGSAHHCGAGRNSDGVDSTTQPNWSYSAEPLGTWGIGTFQGGFYPGGATYGDAAMWSGNSVGTLYPAVLIGGNTGATSQAVLVRGAAASSMGNRVCYSGARSGTICNNIIEYTNVSACYGAPLPCYYGLVETVQAGGTAAVGQGDSGGPVYEANNGPYAAGVISGVYGDSSIPCSGDGGRVCGSRALYSPIAEFFNAGYGLNIVPQ